MKANLIILVKQPGNITVARDLVGYYDRTAKQIIREVNKLVHTQTFLINHFQSLALSKIY